MIEASAAAGPGDGRVILSGRLGHASEGLTKRSSERSDQRRDLANSRAKSTPSAARSVRRAWLVQSPSGRVGELLRTPAIAEAASARDGIEV